MAHKPPNSDVQMTAQANIQSFAISGVESAQQQSPQSRTKKPLEFEIICALQAIDRAEEKHKIFKHAMDDICKYLYKSFLYDTNDLPKSALDAQQDFQNTFSTSPQTSIPTYLKNSQQESLISNHKFDINDGKIFNSDRVPLIYHAIYEIVFKMFQIEYVSQNYPMIFWPLKFTKYIREHFESLQPQSPSNTIKMMSPRKKPSISPTPNSKIFDEKQEFKDDEKRKKSNKRFLEQFKLKEYPIKKKFEDIKHHNKYPRCLGCRQRIHKPSGSPFPVYRRIPWINKDHDSHEYIFHDAICVQLRKYKEVIRQFVFEYELIETERGSNKDNKKDGEINLLIPDVDSRLIQLYPVRDYVLAIDSGRVRDQLPRPLYDNNNILHKYFRNKKLDDILILRLRKLAAYHLYRELQEKQEKSKLSLRKHDLLMYLDFQLYGAPLWHFCVDQLQIKNRTGLWKIMTFLACKLPTMFVLKNLEDDYLSFARFSVEDLNELCVTVITHSRCPAATALYLAGWMAARAEEDESRREQFDFIRENYVEIAQNILEKIESDHLLAIRLELPTNINSLTIIDIAFYYELDDFLEFHRLGPIFINLWREFEYLNPSKQFHTKDPTTFESLKLLAYHPNNFYYSPVGLFIIECAFYGVYLTVFTWFLYSGIYPYHDPSWIEYILWIFNGGFILYELTEMYYKKAAYFQELVNYWDIFISLNWFALFGMRVFALYFPEKWIVYYADTDIINYIGTRATSFFAAYTALFATQCVLLWTRLLSKLQRSNFLAPLIQMILNMITDVLKFAILLVIFMAAFIFAMHYVVAGDLNHDERLKESLEYIHVHNLRNNADVDIDELLSDFEARGTDEYEPPLDNFFSVGLYIMQSLLGQQDWALIAGDQEGYGPVFFNETRSRIVDTIIILFSILGAILLLNLLIALMANTFENVREKSYVRVNFTRSLNTHELINRTAMMPPPFNIFVLTLAAMWMFIEALIEWLSCCYCTFSVERLSPLRYSLKYKLDKMKKYPNKLNKKNSIKIKKSYIDISDNPVSSSESSDSSDSESIDDRLLLYGTNKLDSLYGSDDSSSDDDEEDDDSIYNSDNSDSDRILNDNEYSVRKCCIFEELPPSSWFCGGKSQNTKRYCRYCRSDMRECNTGSISSYFELFRYCGQILDESDVKQMKKLCSDKFLCPHCFRPFKKWNYDGSYSDSNRHSRFQIMLEIISFYVFLIIIWLPLLVLMLIPAFISYIAKYCYRVSRPRAFSTSSNISDIKLNRISDEKNSKNISEIIYNLNKQKNKQSEGEKEIKKLIQKLLIKKNKLVPTDPNTKADTDHTE